MSTLPNGHFYYFLRRPGPAGAGHMGWAFETAAELRTNPPPAACPARPTRIWLGGSVENTALLDGRNDYWRMIFGSEAQLIAEMRNPVNAAALLGLQSLDAYTAYKKIPVSVAKAVEAERVSEQHQGYGLFGNNCMDNSVKVADAYGAGAGAGRGTCGT